MWQSWGTQYRAVYPLIQEKLRAAGTYHDFTSVLDVDEYLYLDFCHLAPKGNRIVAQKIAEVAASLGISGEQRAR